MTTVRLDPFMRITAIHFPSRKNFLVPGHASAGVHDLNEYGFGDHIGNHVGDVSDGLTTTDAPSWRMTGHFPSHPDWFTSVSFFYQQQAEVLETTVFQNALHMGFFQATMTETAGDVVPVPGLGPSEYATLLADFIVDVPGFGTFAPSSADEQDYGSLQFVYYNHSPVLIPGFRYTNVTVGLDGP